MHRVWRSMWILLHFNFHKKVCLFVCFTGCSLWRHAWILMGPDLNKMLKLGNKSLSYAGWVVFKNREEEKDLTSRNKRKGDHSHSQQIKKNNFTVSLWTGESRLFLSNLKVDQIPIYLPSVMIHQVIWANGLIYWKEKRKLFQVTSASHSHIFTHLSLTRFEFHQTLTTRIRKWLWVVDYL